MEKLYIPYMLNFSLRSCISKFVLYSTVLSKTKEISFWDRETGIFAEISRFDAHAVSKTSIL